MTTAADRPGCCVVVPEPRPAARMALPAVALATFFVSLSSSTLSVAVPVIVRHFQAGTLAATFILLTPSVASTALMLTMGRLGDLAGRRNTYLAALGLFTVASLFAGAAPSAGLLIVLEAFQAAATAAIWANNAALVLELVPVERANHALGLYFASISGAQLIGPSVGGIIASTIGWRWIFLLNVPVGIVSWFACWAVLPRHRKTVASRSLDVPGNALVLVGLAGLIISLTLGQADGWLATPVLGGAAVAAVLVGAFVIRELRTADPLLQLRMFGDRPLSLAMGSACANAMAQWSPVLLMVLYFQAVSGDDALGAGLKITPLPVASVLAAVSAGALGRLARPDTLAVAGSAIALAGIVVLAFTLGGGYLPVVIALALIGVGSGIFGPANANVVMSRAPDVSGGVINGARVMLSEVCYLVCTTIVLAIVTAPLAPGLRRQFYSGTASRVSQAVSLQLVTGYQHAFLLIAGLALVGTAAALASRTGPNRITTPARSASKERA